MSLCYHKHCGTDDSIHRGEEGFLALLKQDDQWRKILLSAKAMTGG